MTEEDDGYDENGYIIVAVCECGHGDIDHDWWGSGECTIPDCVCLKFVLASDSALVNPSWEVP